MFAVTGASGRLGRLVVDELVQRVGPDQVVALTRDPAKLKHVADTGVKVRRYDFEDNESLHSGLDGVERLLLISGSELGQRERQHRAAIQAAKDAGVAFIAYTSVLHADTCSITLAIEHRATEVAIKESGMNYALLRHGWYTENTTANAAKDIARGEVIGGAGTGQQSTAARADFAAADAAVLLDRTVVNQTYELAGDTSYALGDYTAALSKVSGKPVRYVDMPEAEYRRTLENQGFPQHVASLFAEASARCSENAMFDAGGALSRLIGRPTTPLLVSIKEALSAAESSDSRVFSHGET